MNEYGTAIVIGAGKTGRGFIGRLLAEEGILFILADRNKDLVNELNDQKEYTVKFYGNKRDDMIIHPVKAFEIEDPALDAELAKAKLVFISIGYANLEELGISLNGRIPDDANLFITENGDHAADKMRKTYSGKGNIGEAAIFCTSNEEGVDILSETINYLPYDAGVIQDDLSDIKFLQPIANFPALMVRKLLTYNAVNAIITYVGSYMKYDYLSQAAYDPEIRKLMNMHYEQIGKAMCKEYGYMEQDQQEFAAESVKKFTDKSILDPLSRNGRNPLVKLVPNERLVGSLRLIQKHGGDPTAIEKAIAYAFVYDQDENWMEYVKKTGVETILQDTCRINSDEPAFKEIMKYYNALE